MPNVNVADTAVAGTYYHPFIVEPTVPTIIDENGIMREESTNLPICRRSGVPITDPELHIVAWDDDYPSIKMGPYNEDSFPYVKVCTGCHTPHMVDNKEDITYHQDGTWLCSKCVASIIKCSSCGKITTALIYINDKEMCESCFKREYFIDDYSGDITKRALHAQNNLTEVEYEQYKKLFEDHRNISIETFRHLQDRYTPLNVGKCKCCHNIRPLEKDGYCSVCLQDYCYACSLCGHYHHKMDRRMSGVCPICIPKAATSFISGEAGYKKSMLSVKSPYEPQYYLDTEEERGLIHMYKMCPTCNAMSKKDRLIKRGTLTYCTNCENKLAVCPVCNKPHLGEGDCRTGEEGNGHISSYSYKPLTIMHYAYPEGKSNERKLFMGFENEQSYNLEEQMRKALDFMSGKFSSTELYFKSDSSIHGYGFEVVSHPFTLEAFNKLPLSFLFKTKLKKKDNGCGLHIHINKAFFEGDMHLYKFTNFITTHPAFIKKIAGRGSVSYSHKIEGKVSAVIKEKSTERQSQVNLQPRDTVEVRIFKGCLNLNELRYRLEFVDALARWSHDASIKDGVKSFIAYAMKNGKKYPKLVAFLKA